MQTENQGSPEGDSEYPVTDYGLSDEPGHEGHRVHWHAAHGLTARVCSCGDAWGGFSIMGTEDELAWLAAAPPCPVCAS